MKLTQRQVATLWVLEGGDPAKADEWSAIVMAESGGDTKVGNYCCHGLAALNVEVGVASMACALNAVCATRKSIELSHNGKDWTPWEGFTNGHYAQFMGGSKGKVTKTDLRKVSQAGAKVPESKFVSFDPLDPSTWLDPFPGVGGVTPGSHKNAIEQAETEGSEVGEFAAPYLKQLQEIASFIKGLGELILTPEGWKRLGFIIGGGIFVLMGLSAVLKSGYGVDPARGVRKTVEGAAVAATVK